MSKVLKNIQQCISAHFCCLQCKLLSSLSKGRNQGEPLPRGIHLIVSSSCDCMELHWIAALPRCTSSLPTKRYDMSVLTVMTNIGFIDQCSGVGSTKIEGAGVGGVYLDVADCMDHHQRGADIPDTRDVGVVKLQAR